MSPTLRQALLAQLAATVLVALLAFFTPLTAPGQPLLAAAALQGLAAASIAHWRKAPQWWLAIHLGFMPLVVLANGLHLPAGLWFGGFVLLLLVFWRTDRSRVPLYLSNAATAAAVADLLPPTPCAVIDLGCGDGGLLARLARLRPDCRFVGIEHAPLPWLLARLRCRGLGNVSIRYGSFWQDSLADYQVIYAFLSPAPMSALEAKAAAECRPGSLLISNSFPFEDGRPQAVVTVADRRATRLYCYRPAN